MRRIVLLQLLITSKIATADAAVLAFAFSVCVFVAWECTSLCWDETAGHTAWLAHAARHTAWLVHTARHSAWLALAIRHTAWLALSIGHTAWLPLAISHTAWLPLAISHTDWLPLAISHTAWLPIVAGLIFTQHGLQLILSSKVSDFHIR